MKEQIKKTILITGASGFVGKQVLAYLLAQNHTIIAPTRNPSKLSQFRNPNLNITETDIFTQDLQVSKYDILIHLAWGKMDNVCDFSHITHNFTQSLDFLQNAIKTHKIKQIAVAGSCFEYGSHYGKISEDFIPNPQTSYGIAKVFLQKALFELQKSYDFRLKWLRIFYLNGIGQNPHSLIPQLQNAIDSNQATFNMSGGEQIRDYLDIKIAAKYIARLALDDSFDGICNVCSGEPISVRNLVENYLQKTRQDIKLNFGFYPYPSYEPLAYFGDNAKLSALLQTYKARKSHNIKNRTAKATNADNHTVKNRKWGGAESRFLKESFALYIGNSTLIIFARVTPEVCVAVATHPHLQIHAPLTVFARLCKKPKQSIKTAESQSDSTLSSDFSRFYRLFTHSIKLAQEVA